MNRLDRTRQVQMLSALVEGNSMRSTARMADVSFNTVVKFLLNAGRVAMQYQDETLRKLTCKRLQLDEIWSFCGMKQANVPKEKLGQFGLGDVWTWTALDADTKLVPCWLVGSRTLEAAESFVCDLASRLVNRVQVTSDGHKAYVQAVESAFGGEVDYAILQKIYGAEAEGQRRYSPPACIGVNRAEVVGQPDPRHISTSYVERQNLTMRMNMRRFTRLTNGFSKKVQNHAHAVSVYFLHYNFVRVHKTLRVTPAMAAGVTKKLWSLEDVVDLVNEKIYGSK
jgi:IS1 family transposase